MSTDEKDTNVELRWNKNSFGWFNSGQTCTMFGAHHPVCSKLTQNLLNQGWRVIIPRTTYKKGDKAGAFHSRIEGPGEHSFRVAHNAWGTSEHKSFQISNTGQIWHKHEVEFDDVDKCRQAIGESSLVGIFITSSMRDNQWQDY